MTYPFLSVEENRHISLLQEKADVAHSQAQQLTNEWIEFLEQHCVCVDCILHREQKETK